METNCLQSRARAKLVLKEPVSNVECEGTRLTDAGRKEKEKETGRKEKVDPKERVDQKGHNPNWHGTTYGLEVDPWRAVEPVPYLCASSYEEFSEPKRMSRGTHIKTSQSGNQRNFAHVSKFSILARQRVHW